MGKPGLYRIRDPLQMVWVLQGNTLVAVPANSNVKPVTMCSVPCQHMTSGENSHIYLGVESSGLCLFCMDIQGQPTLQLKEKNIMDLYEDPHVQNPFLFLRAMEGATSTFESVAYPSWFIATASVGGQPVTLTKDRGRDYNTNFYFEPMGYSRPLRVLGQGQKMSSRTSV
ncbi:Interleukin-1 family member 8 [Pteropus alecto]|uniref:Interleukin-1 n=2 Tax=Pteropus alecto TaxID=9402 RepID=L5KTR5_PTEAL|nr:Interleukin-1 family member 8 [Pteropus alecto]